MWFTLSILVASSAGSLILSNGSKTLTFKATATIEVIQVTGLRLSELNPALSNTSITIIEDKVFRCINVTMENGTFAVIPPEVRVATPSTLLGTQFHGRRFNTSTFRIYLGFGVDGVYLGERDLNEHSHATSLALLGPAMSKSGAAEPPSSFAIAKSSSRDPFTITSEIDDIRSLLPHIWVVDVPFKTERNTIYKEKKWFTNPRLVWGYMHYIFHILEGSLSSTNVNFGAYTYSRRSRAFAYHPTWDTDPIECPNWYAKVTKKTEAPRVPSADSLTPPTGTTIGLHGCRKVEGFSESEKEAVRLSIRSIIMVYVSQGCEWGCLSFALKILNRFLEINNSEDSSEDSPSSDDSPSNAVPVLPSQSQAATACPLTSTRSNDQSDSAFSELCAEAAEVSNSGCRNAQTQYDDDSSSDDEDDFYVRDLTRKTGPLDYEEAKFAEAYGPLEDHEQDTRYDGVLSVEIAKRFQQARAFHRSRFRKVDSGDNFTQMLKSANNFERMYGMPLLFDVRDRKALVMFERREVNIKANRKASSIGDIVDSNSTGKVTFSYATAIRLFQTSINLANKVENDDEWSDLKVAPTSSLNLKKREIMFLDAFKWSLSTHQDRFDEYSQQLQDTIVSEYLDCAIK